MELELWNRRTVPGKHGGVGKSHDVWIGLNNPTIGFQTMTKTDIVEKVCEGRGISKSEAAEAVDAVFELMKGTLESGDDLKISGFGTFAVRKKSARRGRNPQTGEDITIANRNVVTFKLSTTLKQVINQLP